MNDVTPNPAAEAGCPGSRTTITGRVLGVCIGCARWGQPGQQLQPAAIRDSLGVARCPNRIVPDSSGGAAT